MKASEDCLHSPPPLSQGFIQDDDSLLKVLVFVNDINDNAPEFVKRVFTGGVTTEADFGTEFMQIKVRIIIQYLPIENCRGWFNLMFYIFNNI